MQIHRVILRERCDPVTALALRRRFLLGATANRELGIPPLARAARLVAVCAFFVTLTAPRAFAQTTITVNTSADEFGVGIDTGCSLREAIQAANTNAAFGGCCAGSGADTIVVPVGTYTLSLTNPGGVSEDANATGDLDITESVTINGAGANTTTINGGGIDRVLDIENVTSTVTVTVSDVTITGGISQFGGGILVEGNSTTLTLNRSTVSGNTATGGPSSNPSGGGIWKIGTVILNNSTVSGNTATGGINPSGGGITNYQNTLTLNNSTVSGNAARYGGGIMNANDAQFLTLNNSTVSGNTAIVSGGGMRVNGGTVTLKNTILANGNNCDFSFNQPSALISLDHNLSSDLSCQSIGPGGLNQSSDLNNVPAGLAPLANYGGPTKTHALCTGVGVPDLLCGAIPSPAIDAVPLASCTVSTDQRGVPRPPQGAACDIGAYEVATSCTITVIKETNPAGGTGFSFSSGWSGLQGITLDDGQNISVPLTLGCGSIYNVFETPQPGSALTNIACAFTSGTGSFNIIGATTSQTTGFEAGDNEVDFFSLVPGSSLQCTFTNTACVNAPGGMVAWWPLDETGTTANDIALFNNVGTHMNGPTPMPGEVAGALLFDGVDDFVQVANQAELNFGPGDFSIDAWVKRSTSSVGPIVEKALGGVFTQGYSFWILPYNPGALGFSINDGTGTDYGYSTTGVPVGVWTHVAVTVKRNDLTGIKFYVNGSPAGTLDPTGRTSTITNTGMLFIGKSNYFSPFFPGLIDEVEIFNRVLTPTEILDIYQACSGGKCKYPLLDCDVDSVPDINEGTTVKNFCVLCPLVGTCSNGTKWSLEVQWGAGVYFEANCPGEPNTTTSNAIDMATRLVSCINDTACPTIHATLTIPGQFVTCFDLVGPSVPPANANVCVGPPGLPTSCCAPLFTPQNSNGCQFNPELFQVSLSGRDCNGNGVDDAIDILEGTSMDANGNGIPDECAVIPTVSEWGLVVLTLLLLIGAKIYFARRRTAAT